MKENELCLVNNNLGFCVAYIVVYLEKHDK